MFGTTGTDKVSQRKHSLKKLYTKYESDVAASSSSSFFFFLLSSTSSNRNMVLTFSLKLDFVSRL